MSSPALRVLGLTSLAACATPPAEVAPHFVDLASDAQGFAALRSDFVARNPGYDVEFVRDVVGLEAAPQARAAFVQAGKSPITVHGATSPVAGEATVGDLIVLRAGEALRNDEPLSALVFTVPGAPPDDVPTIIRPDWDPRITDTPGGCATETGAYRRIALTWNRTNGPYTWHAINAHRVRITDSFTHYHPREGGFDEFYLVQLAQAGARIVTSVHTDKIVQPETVTRAEAEQLLREDALEPGDLVYLPRGVAHRGLGGVLAHVITVPGFVPGAEIGIDHHLAAINRRLGLEGDEALPLHEAAAAAPVVR
jgi:hypothetical protein